MSEKQVYTLGASTWTVQVRADGDTYSMTGRRSFDIKDKIKMAFPGARYLAEDKSWTFATDKGKGVVFKKIEDWLEEGRTEMRETFREKRRVAKECDCYIGDQGRVAREPGKPFCFLSGRNHWKEERERQRDNFEHYQRRNKTDERWSNPEEAECVACGVNLFGHSRTSHYNRHMDSCYHCEWNLEDD